MNIQDKLRLARGLTRSDRKLTVTPLAAVTGGSFIAPPGRIHSEVRAARDEIITPSLAVKPDSAYIFAVWSNQQDQTQFQLNAGGSVLNVVDSPPYSRRNGREA